METSLVPRRTNHLLHLILTVFTCGAWLFVWPCVWLYNKLTHDKVRTYQQQPTYQPGRSSGYTGPYGQ